MSEPIAIVGRGCVLPGALDPAELWTLVAEGRDAVGPVPDGRWRLGRDRALTADTRNAADRAWSDRGGYVRGFEARFDPSGFALDAQLVTALDPLERWALHASRAALREAGEPHLDGRDVTRAGVVLGNLSFPTASCAALVERHHLGAHPALGPMLPEIDPLERFHSSRVATLTARALRLGGAPSFCIDAACASSLYAIALACDLLRDGRADLMIAGAVNCTDDLFIHVGFCALDALSKSGRSRPFHPEADGLVPAEGAAVVALMRLSDARRLGRRVLGVIRGVGLANDGRAKSFLAPSEEGQVRAMRAAYANAGLRPADVGWVECHATGTPLGDATEVRSTARVFEGCRDVPIGSLKANLGHLITAAGAAGLLRVLGAFDAGMRPPTPHLDRLSSALDGTPLRVLARPEPWAGSPRRAAISAFGFGGNDAHLIVEEDRPESAPRVAVPLALESRAPLALVGVGVRVGPFGSAEAFAEALASGEGGRRAREVVLPLEALRTPPADLAAALGQQTMLLAAALDAQVEGLDAERTAVLVGMQCDAEIARYGLRWRLPEMCERAGVEPPSAAYRDSFAPQLEAAGVLGTMPNIPANRLNRELDLRGPSYTVSEDELSGVRALSIAARALRAGELDAALVGATELGCEPVHEAAAAALLPPELRRGGDAAVVLVIERLADARARGRAILAILEDVEDVDMRDADVGETTARDASARDAAAPAATGSERGVPPEEELELAPWSREGSLAPRFGHAYAASGLLHVAAAALCLHRRERPETRAWPSDTARRARVTVETAAGARAVVTLAEDPLTPPGAISLAARRARHPLRLPAHAAPPQRLDTPETPPLAPPLAPPAPRVLRVTPDDAPLVMPPASAQPAGTPAPSAAVMHPTTPAVTHPEARTQDAARLPAYTPAPATAHVGAPIATAHVGAPIATAHVGAPIATGHVGASIAAARPMPSPLLAALEARQREIAAMHSAMLHAQTELHTKFLAAQARTLRLLFGLDAPPLPNATRAPNATHPPPSALSRAAPAPAAPALAAPALAAPAPAPIAPAPAAPAHAPAPAAPAAPAPAPRPPPTPVQPRPAVSALPSARSPRPRRGLAPSTPPPTPQGPTFGRAALEVHASGRISSLFGDALAAQDAHAVQVRMPEPPLLLADRATGLVGEVASMGKGTVWTETDVTPDAWYLQNGRMPAGLMIESGQADLFLISYLGADLFNAGERSYRLLGCQLTWHRSPPKIGETLCYDIHVDGHAKHGEQRLFFFHYDCHISGAPALTVRSGQAGFFTKQELAESAGVLWSPEEQEIAADARVDPPSVRCAKRSLNTAELDALARGDVSGCFGPGYERTRAHVRTPRIAGGRMRFLETIELLDPAGGPWGRGYLRAVTRIDPSDWYFAGHFKNDPCMPGTLMFEGCLSAMALYLIGLGYTLDRDGWRFEPVPDETYSMICRGQVTPTSKELTYELFVEEVHEGPHPTLYADLLCTVDGLKAFHARRMGLRLVPDFPLTSLAELEPSLVPTLAKTPAPAGASELVASLDGLPLGSAALLASAWGAPSEAFGPRYAEFDGVRRAPRLPGPPYQLVSRVLRADGEPWTKRPGATVEIAYDVPPDAWYFADGRSGAMPYALLLEAALQPCGWLASYAGCALDRGEDLRFRNLDGEGEVLGEVRPDAGTLLTRATLRSLSETASMIIVSFDVETRCENRTIYRLTTTFGFFPDSAFENQPGLGVSREQRLMVDSVGSSLLVDVESGEAGLPRGRLGLLDDIPYFDPVGGRAGLGAARAESRVDPGAWFFRAHFFQDPVQPGSLGMEAMLALLRAVMLGLGLAEGFERARFEPIATGVAHRWKYRGQVRPTNGRVAVTLEVTRIDRPTSPSVRRVVAHAEASFWVDGKRIYEANVAGALIEAEGPAHAGADRAQAQRLEARRVEAVAAPSEARVEAESAAHVDVARVARFWRAHLGLGPSMAEDLYLAALRRFVRAAHIDPALRGIAGRPALYVANHQTAIETLMLSLIAGAHGGVPLVTLAKREHRDSWLGRLLAWFFAHPRVSVPELTAYFDRDDPASLPGLLRALPREHGVLIHAEGTRALRGRAPLGPISGVPVELAIERELPLVPVRFTGGLPLEPVTQRLDFPVGLGAQDLCLGAPIAPGELRALSYKDRVERVRSAIEALGPRDEQPSPGDAAFAAEVARRVAALGVEPAHAVLGALLAESLDPSLVTRKLLGGVALDLDDAEERWAAELAARLGLSRAAHS